MEAFVFSELQSRQSNEYSRQRTISGKTQLTAFINIRDPQLRSTFKQMPLKLETEPEFSVLGGPVTEKLRLVETTSTNIRYSNQL